MTEETTDVEYEEEEAGTEVAVRESGGVGKALGRATQVSQKKMTGNVAIEAHRAAVEVMAQLLVAAEQPRSIKAFKQRALELAGTERFAETAIYCLPIGDSFKEGPSSAMMDALVLEYGNVQVIQVEHGYSEDLHQSSGEVCVWELESNVRKVNRVVIDHTTWQKTKQLIGWSTKAALSKERRNSIKSILPAEVVSECFDKCIQTVDMAIGKNKSAIPQMLNAFKDIGIEEGRLRSFLGIHPSEKRALGDYKPGEVRRLRSVYAAINAGEAKPSDFFKGASNDKAAAKQAERKTAKEEKSESSTKTQTTSEATTTEAASSPSNATAKTEKTEAGSSAPSETAAESSDKVASTESVQSSQSSEPKSETKTEAPQAPPPPAVPQAKPRRSF